MSKPDFSKPHKISEAMVVFPTSVVGKLLPLWEDIPEEFRKDWFGGHKIKWVKLFHTWFYEGLKDIKTLIVKDGINRNDAFRHISACMGSFEPKHEHKVAGVAYLMSLWLDESSTWEPMPKT